MCVCVCVCTVFLLCEIRHMQRCDVYPVFSLCLQPSDKIKTSHSSLASFNLAEYREMLADRAMSLYHEIVAIVHSRLQALIGQQLQIDSTPSN